MRALFLSILFCIILNANAQDKSNYISFAKIRELEGTNYVICHIANESKLSVKAKKILFINTLTGDNDSINFPKDFYLDDIQHLKIDTLGINKVIISGRDLQKNNKMAGWNEGKKVLLSSVDGKEKTWITPDDFFIQNWTINKKTGILVIAGHSDTNKNGKYDKTDKEGILLFSLKELKAIKTIF